MRRTTTRLTIAVLFATMLIAVTASNVLAGPHTFGNVTIVTPEELDRIRDQIARASGDVAFSGRVVEGKTIIQSNQWDCYGQTFDPHATNRREGRSAAVHARSECPNRLSVPFLLVQTQLYKETHCVGSICFGVMAWGDSETVSGEQVWRVEAESHGPCVNGYYKASSAHQMKGPDERWYLAFTVKRARIGNC